MGERKATPDAWTDQERSAMLDHLDRRRLGIEQAMWQAPALTVAAQAFLLFVLTDRSVDPLARGFILVAGIMASAAALLSPIRQRSREVLYSDAIAHQFEEFGLPDTRPDGLPRKCLATRTGGWHRFDKWLQNWAEAWHPMPPMYRLWCLTLVLFIVADVAAFLLTMQLPEPEPWEPF